MKRFVTEHTIRQFIDQVGNQHHALAGAVISASAAQAIALGQACLQISLNNQAGSLDSVDVQTRIEHMVDIKRAMADWCDRDSSTIAEFVALREAGKMLQGQHLLCQAPSEISRLSIEAAAILQDFRLLVSEQVQDDLEMAVTLLAGTAQAAMLLLDSNLRLWPEPALLEKYEPIRARLERQIGQLTPMARIRS